MRRTGVAAAVAGAAVLLAACGGGGSPKKLDEPGLAKLAAGVHTGTRDCPVPYDVAKAADTAGAKGSARPATGSDAVSADTAKGAEPDSPLAENGGAILYCSYLIGSETVETSTIGTTKEGAAVPMMLPVVQRDAQLASDGLTAYYKRVRAAKPDTATLTPSGNVAVVNLPAASGDLALMVSLGEDGRTSLPADTVRALAEALAHQAHWSRAG